MTLGEAQREFAWHISLLIQHIYATGHEVTFGDAYRSPRAHGGMGEQGPYGRAWSAHKQRLAIDLNLFSPEGEYLTSTDDHEQFGRYWVALSPDDNVWGGDFDDGNHYSKRYNGIA